MGFNERTLEPKLKNQEYITTVSQQVWPTQNLFFYFVIGNNFKITETWLE